MEFNLDYLLDKTTEYLDKIDLSVYFPKGGEFNVEIVKDALLEDISEGKVPELPEDLEGDLFKAYDIWDFTVYLRNNYNLSLREEIFYNYWLTAKN